MNISYRTARKEDSLRIAELDYIASGGAIEYLFNGLIPNMSPVQIVTSNLEKDDSPFSYKNVIVAEHHRVIGMSLSFPSEYHKITDEMKQFLPAERLEHFREFFSTRIEGSYFLNALCVDERYRRNSIGSMLVEHTKSKARKEGYDTLSLIVFADNLSALSFYGKLGFVVEKTIALNPHELMPHKGGCLLMQCKL